MNRVIKCCLLILLLCMPSCQRIDLYENYTCIRLDLEVLLGAREQNRSWSEHDKIHYAHWVTGVMPERAEVLLYHPETGELAVSQLLPARGGVLKVPEGDYEMVVYHWGSGITHVENLMWKSEAKAFTTVLTEKYAHVFEQRVKNAPTDSVVITYGYEQHPIINSPEHLYVALSQRLHIPSFQQAGRNVCMQDTTTSIVEVYSLEVLGVQGCENIAKVEAFITGQAKSSRFAVSQPSSEPAVLLVNMEVDADNERLYTIFGTFGKLPGEKSEVYLDITIYNTTGECWRYVYDVSDQFEENNDGSNNLIIVGDDIVVSPPSQENESFNPEVSLWEDNTIVVPL